VIAGLAAALALFSASAPPQKAEAASQQPQPTDPIGELILKARKAADDAVTAVETELKATLYHSGGRGIGTKDSLGCSLQPMRTVAVDPKVFPRHSILFIKETVGLKMPDGSAHDGYWYASDVGGAIKGARIDLFTGAGAASMKALQALNLATIKAVKVGVFEGCPSAKAPTEIAQAGPPPGP
jgi:3D (Asp-Asp-Asp) domain-containing protein